ncbi:MAG: tRNA 2-thiouridine(34) synthase MnmA [Planctomycetes bacterium]|nr:tRNA 2-thiouridine(34) synthase MnmA [Planctomycetota bacterium]
MSGGVDSSVATGLLREQGAEVVGCFMRLGSPGETIDEMVPYDSAGVSCDPAKVKIGHQGCCSINDAADARQVAAELGVPLYVCNFKKDFGRIIDYFVDEYARGRTPNPCVRCNDWLKFGKLHEYAKQIGADFVASGHYARVDRSGPTPVLRRGLDASKDQSYVLFGAPRERLAEMILPVGEYATKAEVRAIAERMGLPVFDKPDSQEICFVPDNNYAGLVERRRPELTVEGRIVDRAGRELGRHAGQHRFTIGQRRGVGVAAGRPIYVVEKRPASNEVVVGGPEELLASSCVVGEANWLADEPVPGAWVGVLAQHRYNAVATPARVRVLDESRDGPSGRAGAFEVAFDAPERAVTPGQAVVLYDRADPSLVLGGGWIASVGADDSFAVCSPSAGDAL